MRSDWIKITLFCRPLAYFTEWHFAIGAREGRKTIGKIEISTALTVVACISRQRWIWYSLQVSTVKMEWSDLVSVYACDRRTCNGQSFMSIWILAPFAIIIYFVLTRGEFFALQNATPKWFSVFQLMHSKWMQIMNSIWTKTSHTNSNRMTTATVYANEQNCVLAASVITGRRAKKCVKTSSLLFIETIIKSQHSEIFKSNALKLILRWAKEMCCH